MRRRVVIACVLAGMTASAAIASPPAGRPPIGPLERHDPLVHGVRFEVIVGTTLSRFTSWEPYRLRDAEIVMPLIMQSTFSRVDPDSLQVEMWLDGREHANIKQDSRLEERQSMNTHRIVMPIEQFNGQVIRWRVSMEMQTWSSRLNDEEAMKLTWPREWPEEVRDALRPQMFIESDDEIFRNTVNRFSNGQWRLHPPYIVAKELIRYAGREIQVTGSVSHRGSQRTIEGLNLRGARETAQRGVGSPIDLVCVTVALLRAAELPARPVIGIERTEQGRTNFAIWAEVYLPNAGWIPFDPVAMRGISPDLDPRRRWSNFGTMRDLNRRIPLAYHLLPPTASQAPMYPAVWGWTPGTNGDPGSAQHVTPQVRYIRRGVREAE